MAKIIYDCPVLENNTAYVSSPFGRRIDPVTGVQSAMHNGIDLLDAKTWNVVDILALQSGKVITVRSDCEWSWAVTKSLAGIPPSDYSGNYVIIDHGNGYTTVYKHLERVYVAVGDTVSVGSAVGKMGTTGYSTGNHLHFEVRASGTAVDPLPYLTGETVIENTYGQEKIIMDTQDNTPQEWALDAVEWAQANGIIFGDENGNLKLRDACTREQMMVFLHRLYTLIMSGS